MEKLTLNTCLTPKQQEAIDIMLQGNNVLLTGPGGCGKTTLLRYFIKKYKATKKMAITSTTGVSAIVLGGSTLHSYTGIGIGKGSVDAMITTVYKKKYLSQRWKNMDVLIVDEISMLSPELFDKLEQIARVIRGNDLPFGGIQLILSGDFCQLPCVDTDKFCFEAESWKDCIQDIFYLSEIIRQKDKKFQKCLNEIRVGDVSSETIELINSRIGKKLTNDLGIKPTILFPLNRSVDHINSKKITKLSQKEDIYEYPLEFSTYQKTSLPKQEKYKKYCNAIDNLQLAIGCQVMLIHNLEIENQLVNGSRGVVIGFTEDLPNVRFLNGMEKIIDYHVWEIEENDKKVARIIQIPLRLGYAFSIHKAQGCSLDYAMIDLTNVFEYGMGYVALSRVKNIEGLSLQGIDWDKVKTHPRAVEFYKNL